MTRENDHIANFLRSTELEEMMADFSDWHVEELTGEEDEEKREYVIRSGPVVFDFSVFAGFSRLTWDSELPSYLIPGGGQDRVEIYEKFKKFIADGLPRKIFGLAPDVDYSYQYFQNTVLTRTRRANLSPRQTDFPLATESDRTRFGIEFLTNPRVFREISVNAVSLENHEDYTLKIAYLGSKRGASLSLILPISDESSAWWNDDVLFWALETHKEIGSIDEMISSSMSLSDKIVSILERDLDGESVDLRSII